jgi:hypothetical protein
LDEESGVVVCAEPVEAFQYRGEEHYQWDVEGEAGGGTRAMDGVDLVGVGGDGCGDEARTYVNIILLISADFLECMYLQDWRNILHEPCYETHGREYLASYQRTRRKRRCGRTTKESVDKCQ